MRTKHFRKFRRNRISKKLKGGGGGLRRKINTKKNRKRKQTPRYKSSLYKGGMYSKLNRSYNEASAWAERQGAGAEEILYGNGDIPLYETTENNPYDVGAPLDRPKGHVYEPMEPTPKSGEVVYDASTGNPEGIRLNPLEESNTEKIYAKPDKSSESELNQLLTHLNEFKDLGDLSTPELDLLEKIFTQYFKHLIQTKIWHETLVPHNIKTWENIVLNFLNKLKKDNSNFAEDLKNEINKNAHARYIMENESKIKDPAITWTMKPDEVEIIINKLKEYLTNKNNNKTIYEINTININGEHKIFPIELYDKKNKENIIKLHKEIEDIHEYQLLLKEIEDIHEYQLLLKGDIQVPPPLPPKAAAAAQTPEVPTEGGADAETDSDSGPLYRPLYDGIPVARNNESTRNGNGNGVYEETSPLGTSEGVFNNLGGELKIGDFITLLITKFNEEFRASKHEVAHNLCYFNNNNVQLTNIENNNVIFKKFNYIPKDIDDRMYKIFDGEEKDSVEIEQPISDYFEEFKSKPDSTTKLEIIGDVLFSIYIKILNKYKHEESLSKIILSIKEIKKIQNEKLKNKILELKSKAEEQAKAKAEPVYELPATAQEGLYAVREKSQGNIMKQNARGNLIGSNATATVPESEPETYAMFEPKPHNPDYVSEDSEDSLKGF